MSEAYSNVSFNFDDRANVREIEYSTIPPGTYLCRVDEVRPGASKAGFPRWALKYVVHEGPETGRIAAWDGLTFSPNAAERTRHVLAALGLPHTGRVDLAANDLVGRTAFVTVEERTYRDPATGVARSRNRVPFGGVRPAEGRPAGGGVAAEEETVDDARQAEIPF